MASIDSLRASDGGGNAQIATVQSTRAPLASTIEVDTVAGINTNFIGTMGTPHTFTDPVTSETITVISEETAVDFKGHVDGANLEIDDIAPGYTDNGSEIGDIIIIRPTTQWGDEIADVLEEAHEDDGSLKDSAVQASLLGGWLTDTSGWSYSAWDSTYKIGTITIPSDGTTKFSKGMRIRISQSTGGTKYGIIVEVNSTSLKVYFGTDYTLNNEAVSSPAYSPIKAPFGFPLDPTKWTVITTSTSDRSLTTSLASLTDALSLPIGAWIVSLKIQLYASSSASATRSALVTLSSTTTTETDTELSLLYRSNTASYDGSHTLRSEKYMVVTSNTTMTMLGQISSSTNFVASVQGTQKATVIKAVCAYL